METVRGEVERNSRSLLEQTAAFADAKERLKCVNERAGAIRNPWIKWKLQCTNSCS